MITGLYTGILGLILAALVLRVVKRRMKYKVGLGDGGIPDLTQAMRVHGNFIEVVPIILIMMMIMEESLVRPWVVHAFGILLILTRVLHAYGVTSSPGHSKGRKIGTVITLLLIISGSLMLIAQSFGHKII